jgi:hypothetical protein
MGGLGVCDEKSGIIRLDMPAVQNGMSSVIACFDCARLRLSVLQGLRLSLGSLCRSWVCSTFCFRFTRDSGVLSEIACLQQLSVKQQTEGYSVSTTILRKPMPS